MLTMKAARTLVANYLLHDMDTERYPLASEAMMVAIEAMDKLEQISEIVGGKDDE